MARLTRGTIVLAGVALVVLPVMAAQLPPDVLVDRYIVQVERLINEQEYRAALDVMDRVIYLQQQYDLVVPEDFHFVYGQLALSAGSLQAAIESVNRYLVAAGQRGEFYAEALQLLDRATVRLEEERRSATNGAPTTEVAGITELQVVELRELAEAGDAEAQYELAERYANGRGVGRDLSVAVPWFRKAADQGYAQAQAALGFSYSAGQGVEQDDELAVMWSRRAAEQGNASGQSNLGILYRDGRGVSQDYTEAVRWFRQAAEQHHAGGTTSLAGMYFSGRGVTQDDQAAATWYRRAAEQGDARAQTTLGYLYEVGRGVSRDYAAALSWYRSAADQGNLTAQRNLAEMYFNGRGVTQDDQAAATWYRRAAEQGNARAQNTLGYLYDVGRGVSRDYAAALSWYRRAAEQGNVTAQHNLGLMYRHGRGVATDYRSAMTWFQRSADQGNPRAQVSIGALYQAGRGVPQSRATAMTWYGRAADQGHIGVFLFNLNPSQADEIARRCPAVRITPSIDSAKFVVLDDYGLEVISSDGAIMYETYAHWFGNRIDDVCEFIPSRSNSVATVADVASTREAVYPNRNGSLPLVVVVRAHRGITREVIGRFATSCSRVRVTDNIGAAEFLLKLGKMYDADEFWFTLYNVQQKSVTDSDNQVKPDRLFREMCKLFP